MRIGAHLRAPGGLRTAVEAARDIGAEAVQLFLSNPRSWAGPRIETARAFGAAWREGGIGPLFVHAPYPVNIASSNPGFLEKSLELCRRSVAACGVVGAAGFVVHAGSGGPGEPGEARARATALLSAVLAETPDTTRLMVELMAGSAGAVASTLGEAALLFDEAGDERLGLVLDTCHLFAAGYALDGPAGVDACFDELHSVGLADRLALIHANDAEFGRGSRRDRHARIGEGGIGLDGFAAVLGRPEVRELSIVVETPSDRDQRLRELATLRRLARG
ncbi:MAG TPA: deoxyribonuclease IV [Actinomycetota bacterium]|nr:deoxyribonuclease IV [Actinomycetota bacterium]